MLTKEELKERLKENQITQEEFASYLDMTRVGLNKTLNHGRRVPKSFLDSLKLLIAEKRGITITIN